MTTRRPGIIRDGVNQPIRDMELAVGAGPQMVMRQFVGDYGPQFFRTQKSDHGAAENDVAFSANKVERGIDFRTLLRLVKRHREIELKRGFGDVDDLVKVVVSVAIETVSGFKQRVPELMSVIRLGPRGGEPFPQ